DTWPPFRRAVAIWASRCRCAGHATASVAVSPSRAFRASGRFDALFFLNRFKRPDALKALDGLTATDAVAWPAHLHLEAQIATARLNGGQVSPALQTFLDALQKAGKVDPVRAQAAQLRLVMAGKEKALRPAIPATPGSVLAMMDAWNRGGSWQVRQALSAAGSKPPGPASPAWATLGLATPSSDTLTASCVGLLSRVSEGLPDPAPAEAFQAEGSPRPCALLPLALYYRYQGLAKFGVPLPALQPLLKQDPPLEASSPELLGALLPVLRHQMPEAADRLRARLLEGPSATARAAAIEDLPSTPADLDALTRRCWDDTQFEAQQTLIQSYAKWKLPAEDQKARLRHWLTHPSWSCRYEAYQALVKLDPATPWPPAPKPTATDEAILAEATRLAERGKPVRLRITFSRGRFVTLKLDPTVAPMNVANLVLLARKHYFDGHLVPRVVPDFVVQMGSPYDTMDGGPGYTVRCEDSTHWYGPGSVGMALAGKDTGGSQFFITTNATPHLTGRYTWMGQVEHPDHDLKVLDALELGARILHVRILR
ncbi:MAG TPA: peptidylprolyl isomerase, partial [Holophagaceae bacterium]